MFTGLAALTDREGESTCATALLVTAAGWAAVAGTTGLRWWTAGTVAGPSLIAVVAAGCALLLTAWTAVFRPFAVAVAAGFVIPLMGSAATALCAITGAPLVDSAAAVAVLGAVMLGALPRLVLVVTGIAKQVGTVGPGFDATLVASQRLLTGCLVGASAAVVLGAAPAALSGDPEELALGGGVACLLLLRARVFAQVPHSITPRIAGLLLLSAVAVGFYRAAPTLHTPMIMAAAVALPAAATAARLMAERFSAVTATRTARLLDVVERLLVVAVVLLAAANLGLTDWALTVSGHPMANR